METPTQVPQADPLPSPSATAWKRLGREVLRVAVAALIGGAVAATVVRPAMERLVHQSELALQTAREELEAIRSIGTLTPPTNDKLFTILTQGIGVTEDVFRTTTVGTTPAAAFATDLTATQQTSAYTQEILIQNTHASQNLCVAPIAWSGVTTCTALCAASTFTCSAAATDGWRLSAGQAKGFRYDGTACVCVVGSAATTNYQSERVIR